MKIKGERYSGNIMVEIYYRAPSQEEKVDKILLKEMTKVSKKYEMILMEDSYFPDICWRNNTAKYKMLREFLTCVENNFLFQEVEDVTGASSVLDLVPTSREQLA